jgi:phosphatidylglycerophosphatase A
MGWPAWSFLVAALVFTPVGIWAATRTAALAGKKDPGLVVVDEVLGTWVALAAIPAFEWRWALAAFALFRLFDIWKPWPVRRLESLPAGTGIVADDLAAGVWAAVVIVAAGWLNR